MVWRHRATGFRPDRGFDLRAAIPAGGKVPHFSDDLWFRTSGPWDGSWDGGPVRGLGLGSIFHRDGTLIATVAQEGIALTSQPRP
jgi:hypothetical protein